jgi:hypothetical protein
VNLLLDPSSKFIITTLLLLVTLKLPLVLVAAVFVVPLLSEIRGGEAEK